jgi:1-acyl-sn-glycerol-3-phosphate acyltransferase
MGNKSDGATAAPSKLSARGPAWHETARLYLGFLMLGMICLTVSLAAMPLRALLPRASSRRTGRKLFAALARIYLGLLVRMGACRLDLAALEALRGAPAMIIAPNHPSMLDAVLILAQLPGTTCIMKTELVDSVLFGTGARLMGYIRNTPMRAMVQHAVADLRQGNHLLLFPEGTRTTRFPVDELQGTTGLIAKKAGVPVQTVFIETDSDFLAKGSSLWRIPRMPVTYRIRLGKRFEAPRQTARFVSELEQYFHAELSEASGRARSGSQPSA